MKKYKLLRDLPTFKAGDKFYIDELGNLCAENTQGRRELVAYAKSTLEKFPNILEEWFEEIPEEKNTQLWRRPSSGSVYYCIDDDNYIAMDVDSGNLSSDKKWSIGNYFTSYEEAERALAKIKAYMTVRRDAEGFAPDWEDAYEAKYAIFGGKESMHRLTIAPAYAVRNLGQIYFKTQETAEASRRNHRKEWELLFDLDLEEKNGQ